MRIWLIGADKTGVDTIRQLQKNPSVEIIVSSPVDRPKAVADGVIERVDHVEAVTPLNINHLARRLRPDLILIDTGAVGRSMGRLAGGTVFSDAMATEIAAISDYPCLVL